MWMKQRKDYVQDGDNKDGKEEKGDRKRREQAFRKYEGYDCGAIKKHGNPRKSHKELQL